MMFRLRNILKAFLITIMLFVFPPHAIALETVTHSAINKQIAQGQYFDEYLKKQLGMPDGKDTFFNYKKVFDWISDGGAREDAGGRSVNHFHNPLTNRGLFGNYSAMIWATLPAGAQQLQNYSWNDVRDYYFQALTAREKTKRDNWFALTFRGVGQIMHLVQDMSVPAHVKSLSFP
jgi:hypothetical protein